MCYKKIDNFYNYSMSNLSIISYLANFSKKNNINITITNDHKTCNKHTSCS